VVDLDVKNGMNGIDEFDALAMAQKIDVNTVQAWTPSGGLHLYFSGGAGLHNTAGKLGPGIDTRSNGGYVVAPPSVIDGKAYKWDRDYKTVLPLPQALVSLLETPEKKEALEIAEEIPQGARNDKLFRFACSLRAKGMSHTEIIAGLTAYNLRCVPQLALGEIEQIAAQAATYDQGTQTFRCTDLGNSERLIHHFGNDLLYCWEFSKWLVWDGKRWVMDSGAMILGKAKTVIRRIYAEAAKIEDSDIRKAVAAHARASEAKNKIKAMIELAEADVPVTPDALDRDKWLLNVENGTIDLRTGELLPHSREHLITKICPVTYDPNAGCPEWILFLSRIMSADDDLIGFIRRAIGYALTGDTGERAMFILHGTGSNGKSTMVATIKNLLGDYSLRTPTQTLMAKRGNGVPNDVARLKGSRFVFANESEESHKLAEATIKDLTGNDTISARYMRAEWFDFRPVCKIWLATNHKPKITGTDNAIWSRLRLIPFNVVIPDDEQDKDLEAKLATELSGILSWAIQGCLDWQKDGLGTPQAVLTATSNYRKESDAIGQFLSEACIESENAKASVKAMFLEYTSWVHTSGEQAVSKTTFAARLKERGFTTKRGTGNVMQWRGLGLVR
jgi:putative DNA primase/helicase